MRVFPSLPCLLPALLLWVLPAVTGCGAPDPDSSQATDREVAEAVEAVPLFTEVARQVGVDFVHDNGRFGELYILEIMGAGAGLFDYDRDGDLDLYLVQGHSLERTADPAGFPSDRLYRNQWVETGELRFTDVTAAAGIDARGYGMGVAVADVDGDGRLDFFVTNYGPDQLWRNRGDGTFEEVRQEVFERPSGLASWSTAATFFDSDGDGDEDLFVAEYIHFTPANHRGCRAENSAPDYCNPTLYQPLRDRLLRNRGDGRFDDVTADAGLNTAYGNGLGTFAADFNGDGHRDLYVANDGMENQLWQNQGDATFVDEALLAGAALNRQGQPEASMGVEAADFDGDGDLDLFMTHLANESNTLYVNGGSGLFQDRTLELGLAGPSLPYTSFGTGAVDFDYDGDLDLIIANGAVTRIWDQVKAGVPHPLKQTDQLLRNLSVAGEGPRFEEMGFDLGEPEVSRAVALGDLDNDGGVDAVVTVNGGPVRIWRHRGPQSGEHWIGLDVRRPDGAPAPSGVRLIITPEGGKPLLRLARRDGSYLATQDPRVVVGLGTGLGAAGTARVEVLWPDGGREVWEGLEGGRYHELRRGAAP